MNLARTVLTAAIIFVSWPYLAWGVIAPQKARLPDLDARQPAAPQIDPADTAARLLQFQKSRPDVHVAFDPLTGAPRAIGSPHKFLSAPSSASKGIAAVLPADPYAPTKTFLQQHPDLFGHGPELLSQSRIKREFVTPHNGMRTVAWEQQVDNIAVFEALLISHTTKNGELVSLSSRFLPDPAQAGKTGTPRAAALQKQPSITPQQALSRAARDVGETLADSEVLATWAQPGDPEQRAQYTAPALNGDAYAQLTWLPMDRHTLRLCWRVLFMSRLRHEMFMALIDVETGAIHVRRNLTEHISDATYRVYTSDSPSPFSPGYSSPLSGQPPLVERSYVTTPALNTNASPHGWIDDGVNETKGNNVDAHLDRNSDNQPDLPRPHGSPDRVFDFPLDLTQPPSAYGDASVVQLFYLCNWYHDKLYDLGFTEAAGNFQNDNFGRGGLGGDAIQADAQDGFKVNNADFSALPDGFPSRMQMYLFSGPSPQRDGALDAEMVLHEYTHGLSYRRVGGGTGLSALQSQGMGEGWSDFYALSILSESSDSVDGTYAMAAYASYSMFCNGSNDPNSKNYYFGLRRYPYTTDLSKNPLTFKDIDPAQASPHSDVPLNPINLDPSPAEIHNQGEVWCSILWEARAELIKKYGWAIGNQLILQLVTDAMNLTPPNPDFVEARDAILAADQVNTGGANRKQLWAAFAKRGLGFFAIAPPSSTTTGVVESYLAGDDLLLSAGTGAGKGPLGGPFSANLQAWTLSSDATNQLDWTCGPSADWLTLSQTSGSIPAGGAPVTLVAYLNSAANNLPAGIYTNLIQFTNQQTQVAQTRQFRLAIGMEEYFAELFDTTTNDLAYQSFTFTPDGTPNFYTVCRQHITDFPTPPDGGSEAILSDDDCLAVTLSGTNQIALFETRTNVFYIGSNGYLTLQQGDFSNTKTLQNHFSFPRVAGFLCDLNPETKGSVSWRQLDDRVAVTWLDVPQYNTSNTNSFQIELFFDGRIRLSYLQLDTPKGVVGLSRGNGIPASFVPSDFSAFPACDAQTPSINVADIQALEGNLGTNTAVNFTVTLSQASPDPVTLYCFTSDATATAGQDYLPIPGQLLTFNPGETNKQIALSLIGDNQIEPDETLFLNLISMTGTPPSILKATATILNDDAPPRLTLTSTAEGLVLTWSAAGCTLETTDTLTPPNWLPVTNLPPAAQLLLLTNAPASPSKFYRLRPL